MKYSIIGQGLVGCALHHQLPDSKIYNRNNVFSLLESKSDVLILAAPTSNRIVVNQNPDKDLADCQKLIDLIF